MLKRWESEECRMLEPVISAFLVCLHENGYFQEDQFTISMDAATEIYNQHFKQRKINIKRFLRAMTNLCLIWSISDTEVVFDRDNVNRILTYSRQNITEGVGALRAAKKKSVFVSQKVAFKEPQHPIDLVSGTACTICSVTFRKYSEHQAHLQDVRHIMRTEYITRRIRDEPKTDARTLATLVDVKILSKLSKIFEHHMNLKNLAFDSQHLDIVVEVADGFGNEKETIMVTINEEILLNIKNKSDTDYELTNIVQLNVDHPEITVNSGLLPTVLKAKNQLRQIILANSGENTAIVYPQVFILRNLADNKEYKLLKELVLHLEPKNAALYRALLPKTPYQPRHPIYSDYTEEIIPGQAIPLPQTEFRTVFPLDQYELPNDVVVVLNKGLKPFEGMSSMQAAWIQYINHMLDTPDHLNSLTLNDYYTFLQVLLYLEEHQMQRDIHDYDRDDAKLEPVKGKRNMYSLEVPGLAEHRPSLLRGDSIFIKVQPQHGHKFQGIVHVVKETSVELGFSPRFTREGYIRNHKYCIFFTFNRRTLRVEHQALKLAKEEHLAPYFFPSVLREREPPEIELRWFERKLYANEEQQRAVRNILAFSSYPAPFLIFGPPGTGKTMTLVEAVKQVWKFKKREKVLVCAPSNNAANEVAKRLVQHIPSTSLLRYLAQSYNYRDLPPELVNYVNYTRGEFYHPTIEAIMKYKIIVSTLVNAARLVNAGIPSNHFSYVFIDESGHATETETLCAIAGILSSMEGRGGSLSGLIVLAGDPKQLGAVTHSKKAEEYGFGRSMLERMMNTLELYQQDEYGMYKSKVLVKLIKNYRSHEAILHIPNQLFYDGELTAHGDHLIKLGLNWEHLPNPNFPILFHSVSGADEREYNSPSFFNVLEAITVCDYLSKLIGSRLSGMLIKEEHIAVVSPYRKQVEKIKNACASHNWNNITIGSVEQIQGQERLIVIVTTVRSRAAFMKFDAKFNLGFLNNPKRFNVALTRAKALLIVVGNADILQLDPNWKQFIDYCIANGGYKGKLPSRPPSPLEGDHEELAVLLEQFKLFVDRSMAEAASFQRGNI